MTQSQFHYGSITTGDVWKMMRALPSSQFHYGSITTDNNENNIYDQRRVSIPLWFDYNFLRERLNLSLFFTSQFHYGSITTYKRTGK